MAYYCKKCGSERSSLSQLLNCGCCKGGNCEPYTGHETGPYHCKKCGMERSSLSQLLNCGCCKGGNCEPIE